MRLVGYVRVSTEEQVESGAGLEAQRRALVAEAERLGHELVLVVEDGQSAKSLDGRTGLEEALAMAERGEVDGLIVAKLDRLARSLADFSALMERSRKKGYALVALDLGVDTSTPAGEMMANVLATFAQFERRLIGQRTKEALAVKRSQGVRLGRPAVVDESVARRVRGLRARGHSFAVIAQRLNDDQVPCGQGGRQWYPSTVRKLALRQAV